MNKIVMLALLLAATCPSTLTAADAEGFPAPALNATTAVLLKVDPNRIGISPKLIEIADNDNTGTIKGFADHIQALTKSFGETLNGKVSYLAFDLPYSLRTHGRLVTKASISQDQATRLQELAAPMKVAPAVAMDDWQVLELANSEEVLKESTRGDLSELSKDRWLAALEETADFPIQLAIVAPHYFRETFSEIDPTLPPVLGGGSGKTLIGGVNWISLGFAPEQATARIVIQTESNQTAAVVKAHIPKMFGGLLSEAKLDATSSAIAMAALGLLQPKVEQDRVVFSLEDPRQTTTLLQLVSTGIIATAKPVAVSQTTNNLKQLALGFHNYADAFGTFPTYHDLPNKSRKLSWRVHILPFIEHADLYNKFHLDEPWDSPHNVRLLDQMPEIFKPVIPIGSKEQVKPHHTTYVAPIGEKTVFGQERPVNFQHITDGTSNTILFVELKTEHAIPWTSPEEYRYDPENPAEMLRNTNGAVAASLVDGSVQRIPADRPASVWNALFTRNGGEVIDLR